MDLTATAQAAAPELARLPLMRQMVWHNSVMAWTLAAGLFALLWLLLFAFKRLVLVRLKGAATRTSTDHDDILVHELGKVGSLVFLPAALYFCARHLDLPALADLWLLRLLMAAVAFQAVRFTQALVHHWLNRALIGGSAERAARAAQVQSFRWLFDGLLWLLAALWLLSAFGINVTGLAAGLGITGLAVAFALQNLFRDLFASLSILLDKTIGVGDFIVLGAEQGTVERIGLRATRVRALSGELIVIPNGEITGNRVHNMKDQATRRVALRLAVPLGTPPATLVGLPGRIRAAVEGVAGARFERAHLAELAPHGAVYEAVWHIPGQDFMRYMDLNQQVNLAILAGLAEAGVRPALPAQSVQIEPLPPASGKRAHAKSQIRPRR